jgi:ribonuclease P protein component
VLPRRLRLTRSQDFEAVRRQGKRWRDPLLILTIAPNSLSHNRFGFVAGRRVGTAVVRNTLKRRLRAAVVHWLAQAATGYDAVIAAQPQAAGATYRALEAALGEAFQRVHLMAASDEKGRP